MTSSSAPRGHDPFGETAPALVPTDAVARLLRDHVRLPALDRLTALAARLLGAESSQVSMIDGTELTVKGGVGVAAAGPGARSPAADALCAVTMDAGEPVLVTDARVDDRVSALPIVRAGVVGSYLGVPLTFGGRVVGALCVYDPRTRDWTDQDVQLVEQLVGPVAAELELAALTASREEDHLLWELGVAAAGVGVFAWDLETDELRWDDRLLEIFAIDRDSFGGSIGAFLDAVHPDDRERVTRVLGDAVAGVTSWSMDYRIVHSGGAVRWITARGRVVTASAELSRRMLGAAYDSTVTHAEEARVMRLIEAMPTGFAQLDHDWRFTYVNAAAQELLGDAGTVLGQVLWDLFPATVGTDHERHYRHAVDSGETVEFEAWYAAPLERHYEIRAWPTPEGLALYFLDVTERRAAQRAVDRAAERALLLAEVTRSLTEPLEVAESVDRLTRLVVPALADGCVVTLAQGNGLATGLATGLVSGVGSGPGRRRRLRDVGWWHHDPAARVLLDRLGDTLTTTLLDHPEVAAAFEADRWPVVLGGPDLAPIAAGIEAGEAHDVVAELAPSTVAVVALRGRGRLIGLLTVMRGPGGTPFAGEELEVLVDVAGRAGLALGTTSVLGEQRELAEVLQRSMLTAPHQPDHVEVAARYLPAAVGARVGGDWYDAFPQPDGATVLVVGDVAGHDTSAAATMGQLRSLVRGIAVASEQQPSAVLATLDRAIRTLQLETTATVLVARLEQLPAEAPDAGQVTSLRWSNAGHLPPLLVTLGEAPGDTPGCTVLWGARPNPLLGLDPDAERDQFDVVIAPGSTLLLYTDGLVERRGEALDVGLQRLQREVEALVASGVALEDLCDRLLARMQPVQAEDDIAVLAVRLHPDC